MKPNRTGTESGRPARQQNAAPQIAPARAAAFHILTRVATSAAHSDDLLHAAAVNALSPEDRNLTTALVLGTLRWQLHLDAILRPMLQRPDADLHPAALLALRLGLFQLLHFNRIPPHAALNESVELARANGAPHAAAMVNAILRRVLRESQAADSTELFQASRKLAVALTPAEQAHPEWLIARWRRHFGVAVARRIAEYDQAEPSVPEMFHVKQLLSGMDDGSRLIAELAAAAVAAPRRILDCCAAPGGKTAVLAARHPEAEVVAADISDKRLSAMRLRMEGIPAMARVQTVVADMGKPTDEPLLDGKFDLILCDVPCSGTGTLARNPEIRHRLRASDLPRQAERQQAILANALTFLSPGGRLVYSTCSLEPEENEAVLNEVLTSQPGTHLVPVEPILNQIDSLQETARAQLSTNADFLRTLPGIHPCDGFFAAVFERPATI